MGKLRAVLARRMPAPIASPLAPAMLAVGPAAADAAEADRPAVDITALTSVFGDDRVAVAEILGDFVAPSREILADIEAGLRAEDAGAVARAAHKLKSSARAVGALALADVAFDLERAGKAEDWPALADRGDALGRVFDGVVAFIAGFTNGERVPEGIAVDERTLRETFGDDEQTIREIMTDFLTPARSDLADLRQAHADRSARGIATAARQLKSAARAVGAHRLADACQVLEQAGRGGEWSDMEAHMSAVDAAFEAVVAHIEAGADDR
jgi:HPt (histidine-containing phosphotransfer) domain-containing protein